MNSIKETNRKRLSFPGYAIAFFIIITSVQVSSAQTLFDNIKSNPMLMYGGCDLVEHNDTTYIVGVSAVERGKKRMSDLRRIGMVKAQKEVSVYVNGADITSSTQMSTSEEVTDVNGEKKVVISDSYLETIREDTEGFVRSLKPLGTWLEEDNSVFYYAIYKPLIQ
ncbi:MAG: hypothetical protein K9G70_08125 [Prolixibacteraceae bacterium]|nr:hypothetical protein [Prolixibacteraceae bacterium]